MTKVGLAALSALFLMSACVQDEDAGKPLHDTLFLELSGLKDLGPNYKYEGWLLINGEQKSIGTFTVNASGTLSEQEYLYNRSELAQATSFSVTIEPAQDNNPAPSELKVLSGDFQGANAQATVSKAVAEGADLSTVEANFLLATPSTQQNTDEERGIWFTKRNALGGYTAGLTNLPHLADGWQYEGWVVINGTPYSTGKFNNASGQDLKNTYGGGQGGLQFPGEDFVNGSASGITFPESLAGSHLMVTIEPQPDNDPTAPFMLQPLKATIPANAAANVAYALTNQAGTALPSGTVSR